MTPLRAAVLTFMILTLAACGSQPRQPAGTAGKRPVAGSGADGGPDPAEIPLDVLSTPEPVPKKEPRSRYGNPRSYEVMGKTYRVLPSAEGYKESGMASWYGRKFHGRRTSSGETYDMYKLTAAHKTLPLPSYVRVTNSANGKSIIVRVNDRGPFHDGRIIDLSYAAAARLDLLHGVGKVQVEAVRPGPAPAPALGSTIVGQVPSFLQVAAYADPINAVSLREQLTELGFEQVEIRLAALDGHPVHRVLLGPFGDPDRLRAARKTLQSNGLEAVSVID